MYITPFMDENMLMNVASGGAPATDYFYAQDGLGTIRQIFDTSHSLVNNYDYEGFGTNSGKSETIYNRFRYTGREFDEETESTFTLSTSTLKNDGLYYYRARTYDTSVGSFTSRDPIPYANLYPYCSANPIKFTDPKGESGGIKAPTFYSCSKCAKEYIECMLKKILDAVNTAYWATVMSEDTMTYNDELFNELYGTSVSNLNQSYSFFETEHFDYKNSKHIDAIRKIHKNINKMYEFLKFRGDIEISCWSSKLYSSKGMPTASGRMTTLGSGDKFISLNMGAFCQKLTATEVDNLYKSDREKINAHTLVHEFTHESFDSDDTRHVGWEWAQSGPIQYIREVRESIYLGDLNYGKMDYDERVNHADTNARFVMSYYEANPKCELDKDCCNTMGESTSTYFVLNQ